MTLLLRKANTQAALEGRAQGWADTDYDVLDDERIRQLGDPRGSGRSVVLAPAPVLCEPPIGKERPARRP